MLLLLEEEGDGWMAFGSPGIQLLCQLIGHRPSEGTITLHYYLLYLLYCTLTYHFNFITTKRKMEPVPKSTILLAYRHLYQHLLRAVKYSKPARYIARDRIRAAFRNSSPQQHFQPAEISRTLEFLDNAAKYRGLEHRIVKNCMHVWWSRSPSSGDGMSPVYVPDPTGI